MESHNIEILLEKYLEANTTIVEEETLRKYFAQESVPTHLEQYAPMFQYLSHAKEDRYTKQIPISTGRKKQLFRWVSVAAVAALLVGVYFYTSEPVVSNFSEYTPEEIAAAQEALSLLAINFNKGTSQLTHLDEFEKNTNKFLIK